MYTKQGFKNSVADGKVARVKKYLAHLSQNPEKLKEYLNLTHYGDTLPYLAAKSGSAEMLDIMLAAGANAKDTSMIYRILEYNTGMIETAIKYGTNTSATYLHTAIVQNKCAAAKIIIDQKSAEIDIDKAVEKALKFERFPIVRDLFPHVKDINVSTDTGTRIVHPAVENEDAQMLDALIKRQAELDAQDLNGNTPLHIAIEKGHMGIINLLMAQKPRTDILNKRGYSAITLAQKCGISLNGETTPPAAASCHEATGWVALNEYEIAYVSMQSPLNQKITDIFNFEMRERRTFLEDTLSGKRTLEKSESFEKVSENILNTARERQTEAQGKTDAPPKNYIQKEFN